MTRPPVRVRPLSPADVDACWEIERAVYPDPWRRQHIADAVELDVGVALGAVDGDEERIVGFALGWVAADEAELANIAVDEGWRREGVGARLLTRFAREVARRGAARIWLEVRESNAPARRFYEGYGFARVGRRHGYYEDPVEDALVMAATPSDVLGDDPREGDASG